MEAYGQVNGPVASLGQMRFATALARTRHAWRPCLASVPCLPNAPLTLQTELLRAQALQCHAIIFCSSFHTAVAVLPPAHSVRFTPRVLWKRMGIGYTDPGAALQWADTKYNRYTQFVESKHQMAHCT